ncbi:hypothetical protein QOZ80_3BG0290160 [Eleusine coracana subsp. coracana]|nr:hypothetical protein QOZ80_3BG0290160 [Eleusine coracana subsp. coracana]
MEPAAATPSTGTGRKRRRGRSPSRDGEGPSEPKAARPRLGGGAGGCAGGAWEHLDLVLSLQGKELSLERKIELAAEFLRIQLDNSSHGRKGHNIQLSRLISFIGNWVQSILNFPENSKKMPQPFDPALDSGCWVILKVCIEKKPSISISLNLLKSLSRVARHSLSRVDSNESHADNESFELFERVLDCISLLFCSNTRAFFNAGVDLWASCVIEVINLAQKVSINERNCCPVLRNLAACLLGQFSSFLRFYANPKNIFHAFVEKILEPLLELLVLLNSQVKSNKYTQAGEILKIVEDVLSNALFHPQHLSGYFGLKSLTKTSAAKDIKGSYHRHLFERFKGIKAENKAVLLAGFGYLLQLFVSRVRNQKTAFASSGALSWLQRGSEDSDGSQQHRESLFEVFMQFMEPVVIECKSYSQKEFSKLGVTRLVEVHCMLKSINVMLKTAIEEKIYVPTEDTSEGSYLNFLQDIYRFLISISEMMYEFWVSALNFEDASIKKILPLIFAEVTAAVGHFLEIEYKVLGDDLVKLWLMIFALSAVNASSKDIKPCSLLASKISSLSSQMICTFSELRQVSRSIFMLCDAVRTFGTDGPDAVQDSFSVASLSSQKCLACLTTLLSDETLMGAVRASIKSMPEGQSSRCIDELTLDLTETLKWTKGRSSEYDLKEPGESLSSVRKPIFYQKTELLGRHLSEIYASVLESVTVTSSNSTLVGKSVGRLINAIRPNFSHLVKNESNNFCGFISSVIGESMSKKQLAKWQKIPSFSWIFVIFFRLYISCGSLSQQCISLMPPDAAVEATELMGNPFIVSSGKEWSNPTKILGRGYFAWIVESSNSLVNVIESLSQSISRTCPSFAPIIYSFHLMILQRLSDLNRQIKAFEYFAENAAQQLGNEDTGNPQLLKETCSLEATRLTGFMMSYVRLLSSSGQNDPLGCYERSGSWDLRLCSLDKGSFPTATWRLLCDNIDIWSSHACKKDLKNFFSNLIRFSFVPKRSCTDKDVNNDTQSSLHTEINLHSISVGLLCDSIIYDQKALLKNLSSSFCRALKKSVSSFVNDSDEDSALLNSAPDLKEIISNLENGKLIGMDLGSAHAQCKDGHWICEELLRFFSTAPGFYANPKSFSRLMNYILHLERVLLLKLLGLHCESCNPMKLLHLFICCRMAMKNLIVKFGTERPDSKPYMALSEKSGKSYSLVWFLRSVQEIVGSSDKIFDDSTDEVKNAIFSLVDKTSELFAALANVNSLFCFLDYKKQIKCSLSVSSINSKALENDDQTFDTLENPALEYVKSMADLLEKTTAGMPVTVKDSKCVIKLENCCNTVCWNRLLCTMSCIGGFLWGLISALDYTFENYPKAGSGERKMMLQCCSIFSRYIAKFETFVDICLHMLFVGNKDYRSNDLLSLRLPQELDCENGFVKIDVAMDAWEKYVIKDSDIPAHSNRASGVSCGSHAFDMSKIQSVENILLENLLKGECPLIAFTLREVYNVSAAIVKLHGTLSLSCDDSGQTCSPVRQLSFGSLFETAFVSLQKIADMSSWPHMSSLVWIDGILRYLEVLGSSFTLPGLNIPLEVYTQIVSAHLKAIGKCILLQGKNATLPTHEIGSSTKTLQLQNASSYVFPKVLIDRQNRLKSLKSRLRLLLKNFVNIASNNHLNAALQVIERALIGVNQYSHSIYEIYTGNPDGGTISSNAAAGIDCLYLFLEFVPGNKRVFKRTIPGLIGALFNIILHLQSPFIFYIEKVPPHCSGFNPDAGAVVLMCVEVITSFVGRHSFQIDASQVSQCLHVPMTLFKGFRHLLACRNIPTSQKCCSQSVQHADHNEYILDRQFSVDIYASCCKLLCTTLRHQQREVGRGVALLEDSVNILLSCLESADSKMVNMAGYFAWNMEETVKCASFFRRIYEEMRQQREILGKHSLHFLAGYISMFSGQGPFQTGITREIDEALRPGVYSLIDICEESDFQQLHTYLGEGPCRTTLADLVRDYKLHFQYQGKI